MRGCLTLLIGFILGVALLVYLSPRPPIGSAVPSSSDVRVAVSDGYLARRIQSAVTGVQLVSVQRVGVTSAPPNQLVVRAEINAEGLAAPAALALRPVAANGTIQVQITSSQVGQVPIPAALSNLAAGAADQAIKNVLPPGIRVVGTSVTPQGLVIVANYP